MSKLITLPDGLSDFAEEVFRKMPDVAYDCVGAGAGSAEYEFPTDEECDRALAELRQRVNAEIDNCDKICDCYLTE